MFCIQLINRMSRKNDLSDDKENRLQEAINYYEMDKLLRSNNQVMYSNNRLLEELMSFEKRFQDNKNLFDKDMRQKWGSKSRK